VSTTIERHDVITASIVGATGYTGALLTDILAEHPGVKLRALTSKSYVGRRVCDIFPYLRLEGMYVEFSMDAVAGSDVVFVCYPHKEAHDAVAALVAGGCKVVDLSADFRLKDPAGYSTWYNFVHPFPQLVAEAVYGLPELHRGHIAGARLVANPGCYPTSIILGLAPAAADIDGLGIIADSKSGVSGAGKSPSDKTHFCSVTEDFKAYSEVGHRHTSEMLQELGQLAGHPVAVSFTPHLLPVDRGILSTVYFRPKGGLIGQDAWLEKYRAFYAGETFVEVCDHVPALSEVQGTNFCRMTVREDKAAGLVKVFSVIDNLVKGASGQAVQNMNCMFGLAEDQGLRRKV
jgi:N-acetyl-gamma-glutamyl-phosphate reductase